MVGTTAGDSNLSVVTVFAKAHIVLNPSASIPSYDLVTTHPEFTSSYYHLLR